MAQGAAYRPRLAALGARQAEGAGGLRRLRLLTAGAAAVLMVELVCIPFTSPRFAVREIVLLGDPRVCELAAAQMALPGNTNLFRAPAERLRRKVEQLPAVARAEVARRFPDRLVVTLERREAVAVIREAEEAMLVNPEGVVFAVRDEWGWGLPELVGPHLTRKRVSSAEGKAELAELLAVLRALGPDPRLRVARVELMLRSEGARLLRRAPMVSPIELEALLDSGAKVRLGRGEQLEAKIKLLSAALDRLGAERIEYMDLSDLRAVYWRPRHGKGPS